MRTTTTISLWIVRLAGAVQIVSGLLFWAGLAVTFRPLHLMTGVLIVLVLWALAVLALVSQTRKGLAWFALLWGLVLPVFGIRQATMLVGPMHWIIQTTHLLMGVIAIGIAMALGRAILATQPDARG